MNKIISSLFICALVACNSKETKPEVTEVREIDTLSYAVFGDSIATAEAISKEEMLAKYKDLKVGDTIAVKFYSEIINTCKKKGCWMTMDLNGDEKSFVKFKDYSFFVPKEGAENHKAVVSGIAFIEETSVEQLKHEAKDAQKTQEEIDSITQPLKNYRFIADGVLIAETK
ncbi:MAG TPA: DUF4920 domain-containing protein [Flavobacterium sp.]|nr:DUF4920 domain-containing protein [Flavobacterium sp.]